MDKFKKKNEFIFYAITSVSPNAELSATLLKLKNLEHSTHANYSICDFELSQSYYIYEGATSESAK